MSTELLEKTPSRTKGRRIVLSQKAIEAIQHRLEKPLPPSPEMRAAYARYRAMKAIRGDE